MKKPIMISLLVLSIAFNTFLLISNYMKSTYTPSNDDMARLAEMIVKVVDSPDYEKIAQEETIYAIKPTVSRFNVANPNHFTVYEVYVKTEKTSHIFMCNDAQCNSIDNGGSSYSQYSEESPILGGAK